MQSSISNTTWKEGDEITLTVTISNNDSIDFPLILWVINYSSSDLSKSSSTLMSEGKVFDSVIQSSETTQTVSSNHLNTTTLTPILIDAHNPAQGLSSATSTPISDNEYIIGTTYNISCILGDVILSGIVTWLRNWFNTKEEHDAMLFTNSGWQTCTLSSGYTVYTSGTTLRVRKMGKFVEVSGIFKNSNASSTSSTTAVKFATIPSGYRPSQQQTQVCQGSGMNRWLLTINTSGEMFWSRYGTNAYAAASAGSWFPYTITYMVD